MKNQSPSLGVAAFTSSSDLNDPANASDVFQVAQGVPALQGDK